MIAPTHITFAEFIYLLILTTTGIALSPLNAITIGISSLLPDIDTEASRIGRLVPFISGRIEKRFGHRTLTHSLLFVLLLAAVLSPLLFLNLNLDLYLCFIIGYATHPFLDTMTVNGVRLFYPFSELKCVFPLEVNQPHRYRVQSGSKVDKMLTVLFLIGCIPTFLIAHQGYERFVRFTQRSVESAIRDYNEFSKTHTVVAEILAHDLLTKEQISGVFEVVGARDEHTLIFRDQQGRLRSLGQQYDARYVAGHALCRRGEPVVTRIRSLDMSHRTLGVLIDSSYPGTLFFGTLRSHDKVILPPADRDFMPIEGSANHLMFNFASLRDIHRLGLANVMIEQGELIARTLTPVTPSSYVQSQQPDYPRYSEISVVTNTDQHARTHVHVGDSIARGEQLAVIELSAALKAKVEHNQKKIFALAIELDQKISDLWEKIYKKEIVLAQDSVEYESQLTAFKNHYANLRKLNAARQKFETTKREVKNLIASENTLKCNYLTKSDRAATENVRLLAKLRPVGYSDSVIHSTVDGVITDIRHTAEGRNQRTTFIIKTR
ncbi:MAG: metal-dependent hydrolase [Ignavibacteriae bacterium]|nr:metal-dependent hydrolase [Ignavibacteriota bacterium]